MIRTEFALTIDDFIEWKRVFEVSRESQAPAVVVLCGFLFFVLGYVISRSSFSGCAAKLAFASLILGLLMLVLSIPLWSLLRPKAKKISQETHSSFNRFYRESRIFEASGSGWKYRIGAREDSRDWKDLFGFVRSGQTIILIDQFNSYPLPASALTTDELKTLEQFAKKGLITEQIFSVPMVASAADVIFSMAKHNWLKRTRTMLLLYSCGLLCIAVLGAALLDLSTPVMLSPWLSVSVLVLPLIEAAHYHSLYLDYWKKSFQNADVLKEAICFNLGTLDNAHEIRKIRYDWFETTVETSRALMLYMNKNSFYLIPKHGLSSEQVERLRKLLAPKAT